MPRRTNRWLADRLEWLAGRYFADVPINNRLQVRFSRPVKTRLGSITTRKLKGQPPISLISINGLFRDDGVPESVIDAVLGHEFIHYAHGWHSPLPRLYRHPHRGGVVDQELRDRGLSQVLIQQNKWVKHNFAALWRQHHDN